MDLRKQAKGRECQIRIPGVCNHNPETTVLCHRPGAGLSLKSNDFHGAWGCSDCHDVVDMRKQSHHAYSTVLVWFYEGIFRTQQKLIDEGKVKL